MTNLKKQMAQDKALRDEARALIDIDIAHAKALVAPENLRERTLPPASEKAQQLLHNSRDQALDKKGAIAAIAGAAISAGILWLVREPLMELIGHLAPSDDISEAEAENTAKTTENTP